MKMMAKQWEGLMKKKNKQLKRRAMEKAGKKKPLASFVLQIFAARWLCIVIFLEILLLAGSV
jgi:hypothetical protein